MFPSSEDQDATANQTVVRGDCAVAAGLRGRLQSEPPLASNS